jgi:hypothetical protein
MWLAWLGAGAACWQLCSAEHGYEIHDGCKSNAMNEIDRCRNNQTDDQELHEVGLSAMPIILPDRPTGGHDAGSQRMKSNGAPWVGAPFLSGRLHHENEVANSMNATKKGMREHVIMGQNMTSMRRHTIVSNQIQVHNQHANDKGGNRRQPGGLDDVTGGAGARKVHNPRIEHRRQRNQAGRLGRPIIVMQGSDAHNFT